MQSRCMRSCRVVVLGVRGWVRSIFSTFCPSGPCAGNWPTTVIIMDTVQVMSNTSCFACTQTYALISLPLLRLLHHHHHRPSHLHAAAARSPPTLRLENTCCRGAGTVNWLHRVRLNQEGTISVAFMLMGLNVLREIERLNNFLGVTRFMHFCLRDI